MKLHHVIVPALALAGSGYWLFQQNDVIRSLTEKTRVIRERVVMVEKATSEVTASPDPSGKAKGPDGSPDWKMIAGIMVEMYGNNGMPANTKAILKVRKKFMEMTEDELTNGLAQIPTLDLKPEAFERIRQGLLSQLSERNALAALNALDDPTGDRSNQLFWTQNNIFSKVAKENPPAAIAWLDQKIAEGKLRSTSLNQDQDPRLQLESVLINQLISSDYDTAKSRLEEFSNDEKAFLLSNNHGNLKGGEGAKFLELARESLPPEKASEAITSTFSRQYHEKLSDISSALSDVPLSKAEKTKVIESLVSNYSRSNESEDKFQEIYQWSKTESPGQEVALVSNALSNTRNSWEDPQASFEKAISVSDSPSTTPPSSLPSFPN